jgi:hypothetical protein
MPKLDVRNRADLVREARRIPVARAIGETRLEERRTLLWRLWVARTLAKPAPGIR